MNNHDHSSFSLWRLCLCIVLAGSLLAGFDVADSAYEEFHDAWTQTWSSSTAPSSGPSATPRDVSAMGLL